ncbi:recombinase RecT [Spiroplasma endosymbiont of Panzeria rudis]|uniref:recombinase RecT n=1 Tax=Spiroplasma endosymbiont of Panzeria rudis TaxID=3066301 RepID=UPI0030CAF59C
MSNDLIKNKNSLTIEQWFTNKNQGNNMSEKEVQRFKSNALAIKNQLGLAKTSLTTILEACYQATLLQLPLEKNFGYCWVVPFNRKYKDENGDWITVKEAQFQMGYKGYIQLAQRSQQYKKINVIEVREGELKKIDYLKDEIKFKFIENPIERLKSKIVGYCAYFKLKNGFEKNLYWTSEQIIEHFNKYSETYKKNKKFIVSDFDSMALKTVLTQLLRKWGIMSVDMQIAYENDQAIITENEKIYIDNPNNHIIDIIDSNPKFKEYQDTIDTITNSTSTDNTDLNSTLSKLKELEKEEEIIENFEV